jgi:hypothetical protein
MGLFSIPSHTSGLNTLDSVQEPQNMRVFANSTCSTQFMSLRMRQILMTSKDLACKQVVASAPVAYANHPGFG